MKQETELRPISELETSVEGLVPPISWASTAIYILSMAGTALLSLAILEMCL